MKYLLINPLFLKINTSPIDIGMLNSEEIKQFENEFTDETEEMKYAVDKEEFKEKELNDEQVHDFR
jgi:hypothetical protein